jgi:DNA polymerase I
MRTSGILIDLWHRPSTDTQHGAYLLWLRTADGILQIEDREFRPSFSVIPSAQAKLVQQAVEQHDNVARAEVACRFPSLYAAEKAPVIRAFLRDERRAEETMREIRARAPAEVRFAEWKLLPELQWYYLRRIPPHSSVAIEANNGILRSIKYLGPADAEALRVMAVYPAFTSKVPASCRIQSITLRYGKEEASISGREADVLAEMQRRIDDYDPDAIAIFDADWEALPLLGLRARDNGMRLRLGRLPGPTRLYLPQGPVRHWQARQVRAPGRILLDLWKDARTDADLKRTGLELDDIFGAEFHDQQGTPPCRKQGTPPCRSRKSPASMVYDLATERLPMLMSWCQRCLMPLDSVCREKHGFMNASSVTLP